MKKASRAFALNDIIGNHNNYGVPKKNVGGKAIERVKILDFIAPDRYTLADKIVNSNTQGDNIILDNLLIIKVNEKENLLRKAERVKGNSGGNFNTVKQYAFKIICKDLSLMIIKWKGWKILRLE